MYDYFLLQKVWSQLISKIQLKIMNSCQLYGFYVTWYFTFLFSISIFTAVLNVTQIII